MNSMMTKKTIGYVLVLVGIAASASANARLDSTANDFIPANFGYFLIGGGSQPQELALRQAEFAKTVSQFGFALMHQPLHGANTLGMAGFDLSIGFSYADINQDSVGWRLAHQGTSGAIDPEAAASQVILLDVSGANPAYNLNHPLFAAGPPSSYLPIATFELRKGFPFSIEFAARASYLIDSSEGMIGGSVRYSPLEGYRYTPDLSVGAFFSQLVANPQLDMNVKGFELLFSEPLPAGPQLIVTPFAAVSYVWLRASARSLLYPQAPFTVDHPDAARNETFTTIDDNNPATANIAKFDFSLVEADAVRFGGGLRFTAGPSEIAFAGSYTVDYRAVYSVQFAVRY